MTVLRTAVNTNSPEYIAAAEAMETKLAEVNAETPRPLPAGAEIRCPSP
ncbi:Pobable propionyl-CoA carboxylase beta subunit AccD2 [Mycobacteroides abscessus]|nr:Pobable propionyl-CoA carboxylase beta subunit AccD2 [Mycobacteroides abscessus]